MVTAGALAAAKSAIVAASFTVVRLKQQPQEQLWLVYDFSLDADLPEP